MANVNLGRVSINPRGNYASATLYAFLDTVFNPNTESSYVAIQNSTNIEPGVTSSWSNYWMQLAGQGAAATVTVGTTTTLPAGSNATVTNAGTQGAATFNFGIPKGNQWYTGTAITGTSLVPTAYATGISNAGVGDLYINVGIGANQCNIYQCTTGGDANQRIMDFQG